MTECERIQSIGTQEVCAHSKDQQYSVPSPILDLAIPLELLIHLLRIIVTHLCYHFK